MPKEASLRMVASMLVTLTWDRMDERSESGTWGERREPMLAYGHDEAGQKKRAGVEV